MCDVSTEIKNIEFESRGLGPLALFDCQLHADFHTTLVILI